MRTVPRRLRRGTRISWRAARPAPCGTSAGGPPLCPRTPLLSLSVEEKILCSLIVTFCVISFLHSYLHII